MTIVSVFNQEGGVGKTTMALNLSAALAQRGHRTIGIDLDPQAQFNSVQSPVRLLLLATTASSAFFSVIARCMR
jgi:anion-transporting  ArsA/GET3 family ATPase